MNEQIGKDATITAAYIRGDGLAFVEFEPIVVTDNGWTVQIGSAYAWAVNGPSAYVTGRGRIVKRDGTVGARILETRQQTVPRNVLAAMRDLLARKAV